VVRLAGWLRIDRAKWDCVVPGLRDRGDRGVFVGGRLKLRLPLRHPAWVAAYISPGRCAASILGVALCAHLLLGLDPAMALLAGPVLARPTRCWPAWRLGG
jgi:hypothetical protein